MSPDIGMLLNLVYHDLIPVAVIYNLQMWEHYSNLFVYKTIFLQIYIHSSI